MFRHKGNARTLKHNLGIASLLSFIAGLVMACGFLVLSKLTTNITGHFAFFVADVLDMKLTAGFVALLYILCFFAGSFTSGLMVEFAVRRDKSAEYLMPALLEIIILASLPYFAEQIINTNADILACILLFTMGLQNSLVTTISNSAVRTTHLTGLFTDLGLELAQLVFYKNKTYRNILWGSVRLRLTIISFFFSGGIIGGMLYSKIGFHLLTVAAGLLLAGLSYDSIKLKLIRFNRKRKN